MTHSVGACEDLSPSGLLIEAVRSAVRRRTKSLDGQYEVECLPTELRRLFKLLPLARQCFVLRVLVGLLPEVCAELLDISVIEFEDAVYEALTKLPTPPDRASVKKPVSDFRYGCDALPLRRDGRSPD